MSRYTLAEQQDFIADLKGQENNVNHDDQEKASIAMAELEQAVEAWHEFEEHWNRVADALERLDTMAGRQIDAYKPFVRDQGMGDHAQEWFNRAQDALDDILNGDEQEGQDN